MKKITALFLLFALISPLVTAKAKYISPNNDGVQDELEIPLNISDKRYVQAWSLVILDSNRNVIRTIGNKVALPSKLGFKSFFKQLVTPKKGIEIPKAISWNGAMNNGETAPDGTYYYYVTATDDNGNVGKTKEYEVVIDTLAPDISLVQPADKTFGEGSKSSLKIKQSGSVEDEWTGVFKSVDGTVVRTYKWTSSEPAEINWFGTDDLETQIKDGIYSYEISATDRAGNKSPEAVITNIIYSADKPATNIIVSGSRYFSPATDSDNQNVVLDVTIPVPDPRTGNKLVEWSVVIEKDGLAVRSFNQEKDGITPPAKVVFDGKDDNGNLLKDGEYKASVNAKYLNGYVPAKISSPMLVLDTQRPNAMITPSDKVFGAGSKDSVTFKIVKAPDSGSPVTNWTGYIKDSNDNVVRSYNLGEYLPETVVWNGIDSKGKIADKGDYVFVLDATDAAGNRGIKTSESSVTFDTTEAQLLLACSDTAFSPNGDKVKDTITFTPVTSTSDIAAYDFVVTNSKNTEVYSVKEAQKLPANIVWDGKGNDKLLCSDGIYTASLKITAANGSVSEAAKHTFKLDTLAPSLVAEIPWSAFSPDGDGNQDNIPVTIKECSDDVWTAEVVSVKGNSVWKYSWNGVKNNFIWNGTDASGNAAADGTYNILITSADAAGNTFKTELQNIILDSRETKAYLTAEYEGISPNNDKNLDVQKFEIKVSVAENIRSWNFNVRKENGDSVFSLSEKDNKNLPASITWNGADKDGNVCEGTFTGTLDVEYLKGNKVSSVSAPFVCTASAPKLNVQTAPQYFSPDNDGVDDDLYIRLTGETKAKIKNWSFVISDPKGKAFWKTSGKNSITERIIWDGLSNIQKDASGNAERVQSAMDYPYEFTVTDNLGMTSVKTGIIPVDVLVIREGNVLKMAVPSIIFESDSANFQNANNKLSQEQITKNLTTLNRIADILKKFKDYKVQIVGHANKVTDNPEEETVDNLKQWGRALTPLSKERAEAIKAYLVKRGVSASSVTTDGLGGTRPVVNPKDKDNNWKNRRVEFILQK
jgi:outer membrane protein OmpA-like peptidoglycan-associated protein/flagellar hook assembly protein FlgD